MTLREIAQRVRAVVALFSLLAASLAATVEGAAEPGVWTADFASAKARADAEGIPLLIFWGKPSCSYCNSMKKAFETAEFKTWQSARGILMVKSEGDPTVKKFVKNDSGHFPYMCVYWNRGNGDVVKTLFSGRSGEMPAKGGTLARQLIDSVERDIADWHGVTPAVGIQFALSNTAGSHLEIVPGRTTWLDVPLKRAATASATNALVASFSGFAVTNRLEWSEGETQRLARVDFAEAPQGDVALALLDANGGEIAACAAEARTNLAATISWPRWIGEPFGWGEWTMDLDAAKEKAQAEGGLTLVNVGGDLWCPWCKGCANDLYADPAFAAWAESNRVALVSIDQPRLGTHQASLLTYDEDKDGASGAYYRSSKMINEELAQEVLARNERFTHDDYLLPSTGAARIANPTALLFNGAGEIVGRLNPRRTGERGYPAAENIARLDELAKMARAGQSGEARKDSSTTDLELSVGRAPTNLVLSVNDNAAVIRLTGLKVGENTFEAVATNAPAVTLELFATTNTLAASERKLLASGTGTLAYDCAAVPSEGVFLRVSAYGDASGVDYASRGATAFAVKVESRFEAKPGEVAFTAAEQSWLETAGNGRVTVRRTGGASGVAAVRVAAVPEETTVSSNRCAFVSADLVWAEGESGEKSIEVPIIANPEFEGRQNLVLKLEPLEGNTARLVEPTVQTNVVFDTDDPVFGSLAYEFTFYCGFQSEVALPVHNVRDAKKVSLKRLSGALPSGVTLKVDKASGGVVLVSKATRAGERTAAFALSERRTENRRTTTVTGLSSTLSVRVVDPRAAGVNAYVGTARKQFTIPVYADTEQGRVLAGTLTLSVTARNAITAKFIGAGRRTVSFKGAWQDLDAETGTARATLAARTGETLVLALANDGTFFGTLENVPESGSLALAETRAADAARLADYAGFYTVTFPVATNVLAEGGLDFAGTGYLTIDATGSSFLRSGTAKFSGVAPDGQTLSGSATVIPDAYEDAATGTKYAAFPVFCRTSLGIFAAELTIRAGGAAEADKNPYDGGLNPQIVREAPGSVPYLLRNDLAEPIPLECYGGAYNSSHSLWKILEARQGDVHAFTLDFNAGALADSAVYGAITALPEITVANEGEKLTAQSAGTLRGKLTFAKRTGLLSGTIPVRFANGRVVSGKFRGVLLPGWHDCQCGESYEPIERPLASGVVTFADKVGRKTVTRTFSADLVPSP